MSRQIEFKRIPEFTKILFVDYFESQTKYFFESLGLFVDREVQKTFNNIKSQGGGSQTAYNRTVWKGYSASTLHPVDYKGFPDTNRWRTRIGTDGSKGKYSASSKLNQKSGLFRKSWKVLQMGNRSMTYGSNHPLVYPLIKNRTVINYDSQMKRDFQNLFTKWALNTIKQGISKA